jgi:hypothetical protein
MKPYKCKDVAGKLGISPSWLARRRFHYINLHGMPRPLPGGGHPKWDRAELDAWLKGREPVAAANDAAPTAAPEITAWQAALDQEYATA